MATDLLETSLHPRHREHGARLVEFAGWTMPVQYTTIAEEHGTVRNHVGLFDIGHMGRLLFEGADALDWLEYATTNHVSRLVPGQIQYSLMCNGGGGVIDDILVYRLPEAGYLVVCNASNRGAVLNQFERLREGRAARLTDLTTETAMIAVQGPEAWMTLGEICRDLDVNAIRYYHLALSRNTAGAAGANVVISRTGYSGEDGFELILPSATAPDVWDELLHSGDVFDVRPCGLGARDTLRFEAAMPLYGHELSETINPYAAGVGWAVKLTKGEFVGREALGRFKSSPGLARVGLRLEGKRIARQGSIVRRDGLDVGLVTSGTFSPTLGQSLAMALVDVAASSLGTRPSIDVRGHDEPAQVVALPFYRRPKAVETPP